LEVTINGLQTSPPFFSISLSILSASILQRWTIYMRLLSIFLGLSYNDPQYFPISV
jgi:hypothetical protein